MSRLTRWMLTVCVILCAGAFAAAASAQPRFAQCPAVGADTGCQYLITVSAVGASLATDPSQPSYANNLVATRETGPPTDALIGVRNETSAPLTSLQVTGPITFEFDGDGICDNASGVVPSGCASPSGSTACGGFDGPCSLPPSPGEPARQHEFGAPAGMPAWPNGDVQNGYEGPTSWFSNIGPSPNNSGTVNFSPAVPPGGSSYFALEAPPKNLPVTTSLSAAQRAGGAAGAVLYLPQGISVQATAQLNGGTGHLTGGVTFRLYRDPGCTGAAVAAGTSTASAGPLVSRAVRLRAPGVYRWQVAYTGDGTNAAAVSGCGAQVVVVPRSARLGLPRAGRCVSELRARLLLSRHPARSAEVFARGRLVGRFGGRIRLRITRRERVAVIASSARRAFARRLTSPALFGQQSRTYRPC